MFYVAWSVAFERYIFWNNSNSYDFYMNNKFNIHLFVHSSKHENSKNGFKTV